MPSHQLKSIWALALLSNILNNEPCKAIPWGGCVWISLKPFVTRTTGKTPAFQRAYSLHSAGGFQHCLEGQGENHLKSAGGRGRHTEADCTQSLETSVNNSMLSEPGISVLILTSGKNKCFLSGWCIQGIERLNRWLQLLLKNKYKCSKTKDYCIILLFTSHGQKYFYLFVPKVRLADLGGLFQPKCF